MRKNKDYTATFCRMFNNVIKHINNQLETDKVFHLRIQALENRITELTNGKAINP